MTDSREVQRHLSVCSELSDLALEEEEEGVQGAHVQGANLQGANTQGANVTGEKKLIIDVQTGDSQVNTTYVLYCLSCVDKCRMFK